MTHLPRALRGPVRCMARPARPNAEAKMVREAGETVRTETGLRSARAVSREIARRVGVELLRRHESDELDAAMAALEHQIVGSPFQRLASDPDINTEAEFVARRVARFAARSARHLSPEADASERRAIMAEIEPILAARYDWQLRRG